jgi:NDP-sugar pyrophosphorylase family protein
MILAAGLGTRLRPLTSTIPKPLLPVGGTPLIVWNLLLLRRAGITEVIVNLHHLGELIEKELGDGSRYGVRLRYSREPVLLGTGGGIKQAGWFLRNGSFLVLNGDTLLELDVLALIEDHRRATSAMNGALATLVVRTDPEVTKWGVVEVSGDRVVRINGRGNHTPGPTEARMFAGVHVIESSVLDRLPAGRPCSIIDTYVDALAAGQVIRAFPFEGYWSDVGTVERYDAAQRDAERGMIDLRRRSYRPPEAPRDRSRAP